MATEPISNKRGLSDALSENNEDASVKRARLDTTNNDLELGDSTIGPCPAPLTAHESRNGKPRRANYADAQVNRKQKPNHSKESTFPQTDVNSGQKSFFPGVDEDHEGMDSTTRSAMAYLRSVRTEARNVPSILTAPKDKNAEGYEVVDRPVVGAGGYYSDGAFVANSAPQTGHSTAARQDFANLEKLYQELLLRHFVVDHLRIKNLDVVAARKQVPASRPVGFPGTKEGSTSWAAYIRQSDPTAPQLACMSKGAALRLIKLLTSIMKRGKPISKRLSIWLWSALARLDDVGTLVSEEVAVVRELGKKAASVKESFEEDADGQAREGRMVQSTADGEGGWADVDGEIFADEEEHPSEEYVRLVAVVDPDVDEEESGVVQFEPPNPSGGGGAAELAAEPEVVDEARADQTTKMTVDMVLLVVGHRFGQADLLAYCYAW